MTIQTIINDGISTKTRTWRKVYRIKNYTSFLEGFMSQAEFSKWGQLYQLKGNNKILLAKFGKAE